MRALRQHFIDQKQAAAGSQAILNSNGMRDFSFRVHHLAIKIALTIVGTGLGGNVGAADLGQTTVELRSATTNKRILNNVKLATLDLWAKSKYQGNATAYDALADQSVPSAIGGTLTFLFRVPFYRPRSSSPFDFVQTLADIGQLTINWPSSLSGVTGVVTSATFTASLIAVGVDAAPGEKFLGAQPLVEELSLETGNDVYVRAHGSPIEELFEFSLDPAATPISDEDQPRVEFDGREVINMRGASLRDAASIIAPDDGISSFATRNAQDLVGYLVPAGRLPLTCKPAVDTAHVQYASRAATTTNIRHVLETIQTNDNAFNRVPNPAAVQQGDVASVVARAGTSGKPVAAPEAIRRFMPIVAAV